MQLELRSVEHNNPSDKNIIYTVSFSETWNDNAARYHVSNKLQLIKYYFCKQT